jgi:hypothetical protein
MAKPKSPYVQNLDAIQVAVNSFLKPLNFRKKGRTHNRRTKGELTHVISFQMGQYPLGDSYVIPGLRESFYGKFAVNLGVLLPFVYQVERQQQPSDFVQEYDCTIRQRLGTLAFGKDEWFEVADETAALTTTVVDLLDRFGLAFLEQFQTYGDVLSYYNLHGGLPFQTDGRASLEAALIAHHIGDESLSKALLAKAHATGHKGFQQHVAELAKRIGSTFG